jgi:hypothetical protein
MAPRRLPIRVKVRVRLSALGSCSWLYCITETNKVVLDQRNQPTAFFNLDISIENLDSSPQPIVIIFKNCVKLETFGQLIAPIVKKNGKKLGVFSKEAVSMSQIVLELLEGDPSLAEALFISDSDPLYDQLIDSLKWTFLSRQEERQF